ncbi:MAG: DUF302 domain-containing protein [Acinetobacter sp.]|nr:DUF302 domain-containing protein [Acinetobacter sp.]
MKKLFAVAVVLSLATGCVVKMPQMPDMSKIDLSKMPQMPQVTIVTEDVMSKTLTVESPYTFAQTKSKITTALKEKGMTIFAEIDHQAAAKKDGLTMQPATVIVFGTPKAGTPLMVKDPDFALQLPLKVLVTEVNGKVRVVMNRTDSLIAGSQIQATDVANSLAKAEGLIQSILK